jgi:hypothetical protein
MNAKDRRGAGTHRSATGDEPGRFQFVQDRVARRG